MARRANTIAAADAEHREPGRVAQVFEGHDPTPPFSKHKGTYTPRGAYGQQHPFPEASNQTINHQAASPSKKPVYHLHGCFLCEIPWSIETCDGWKRHMKEHWTVFTCIQCDTAGEPRSYTRMDNLVMHLFETHKISKSVASAQADTWRSMKKRKYFSCGFCVSLFVNVTDQLNHIDTEHFRRHQGISGWNISTAIKGLIQQPGVHRFWQRSFSADYLRNHNSTWDGFAAKFLQLRLELGQESAEDLATAAKSQAIWTEILPHSHRPGAPGNLAFTSVNIPLTNSPLYDQKNFARDDREGKERPTLPGFADFIAGVEDLVRRGK